MLLTDFKKVAQLDSKILALHSELSDLYSQRQALTVTQTLPADSRQVSLSSNVLDRWVDEQYEQLQSCWQTLGIKIPSKQALRVRLVRAEAVVRELQSALGGEVFELMLVPPTAKISLPASQKQLGNHFNRARQVSIEDLSIAQSVVSKKWQLLDYRQFRGGFGFSVLE